MILNKKRMKKMNSTAAQKPMIPQATMNKAINKIGGIINNRQPVDKSDMTRCVIM